MKMGLPLRVTFVEWVMSARWDPDWIAAVTCDQSLSSMLPISFTRPWSMVTVSTGGVAVSDALSEVSSIDFMGQP